MTSAATFTVKSRGGQSLNSNKVPSVDYLFLVFTLSYVVRLRFLVTRWLVSNRGPLGNNFIFFFQ